MLVPVWEMLIGSSLRQRGVWMTDGAEAATVWVPPGGAELSPAEEEHLGELLQQLLPERHGEVDELLARFAENHPHEPHHYLSIFGTHPDQRGRGIGMALLARDLERIDAEHMPAYLESTNAANNPRYESAGFRAVGAFSSPGGEVTVTTMWRDAR
jgi:GNAT superfamily N-acetyltransferase